MSSNLMDTEEGGEQTQYEGAATYVQPQKKSGGQLGDTATTTNPSKTAEGQQRQVERGEKTAENIRYGQTISEGGMGGMTDGAGAGEAGQEGYGRMQDQRGLDGSEAATETRGAQGYGGGKDMDSNVGA